MPDALLDNLLQAPRQPGEQPSLLKVNQEDFNLENSSHPTTAILTFLFKGLALAIYLFFSLFLSSIFTFILTTLASIVDFWITKNISGRILVGLRWWRAYDVSGTEGFQFESHQPAESYNRVDSTIFWSSQVLVTGLWAAFLLLNMLGFNLYWSLMTGV